MHNTTSERTNITESKLTAKVHAITRADLPLSCPLPSANQWNTHPRVFLNLDGEGKATCPYCSSTYILQQED